MSKKKRHWHQYRTMLSQTRMLTYEEQDEMIRMTNEMYEEKKRVIEEGNARIAEILNESSRGKT